MVKNTIPVIHFTLKIRHLFETYFKHNDTKNHGRLLKCRNFDCHAISSNSLMKSIERHASSTFLSSLCFKVVMSFFEYDSATSSTFYFSRGDGLQVELTS